MKVSVVMPTKNEEKNIGQLVEECREVIPDCEIIVVDDSNDKTPEIAKKLGCKVIEGVRGYGRAYIEGFKVAKGDYIVTLDADGSYSPREIPKLLEPLIRGKADFVIGSRFKGKILPGAMPWLHRYIGNPLLTFIMNLLFKAGISDAHSGMRALTKEALKKMSLKCPGMECASEMIIEAKRRGLRIAEVPITYYPRRGESKLRSFRDGWRHLRFMLLLSPTAVFLLPSILLLIAGISLLTYVMFFEPVRTHTLVLASLLIMLGIQVLFFGISSKIYSYILGLVEEDLLIRVFSRYSVLEEGIIIGSILTVLGVIIGYRVVGLWFATGMQELNQLNSAILSFLLVAVGVQIIFNSFFISSLVIHMEEE